MPSKTLTLNLPDPLYQRIKQRAERINKSVEDVATGILASVVPTEEVLPSGLAEALSPLALFSDEQLWQVARNPLPSELPQEMEALHRKRGCEGLSESEEQTLARLVRHYERTMLLRAQAAAYLRERGHDVTVLLSKP